MKALVLAAGFGTRLGDLTRATPKALLPIAGEPLLAHTLRWLAGHGYDEVAVNIHAHADQFEPAIGDGSRYGVRVTWVREPRLLGTAGTVASLASFFGGGDALVVYGDILSNADLTAFRGAHAAYGAHATLMLHRRAGSNSAVVVGTYGQIEAFVERGEPTAAGVWVNSGVQILGPVLRRRIKRLPGHVVDLAHDVYPRAVEKVRMFGYPLFGTRFAIDSPETYRAADAWARSGARPRPV